MRLDKLLSNLGVASRAGCRELLKAGRVQVDGQTVRDGAAQVSEKAAVLLDGTALDTRLARHLMLFKPAGVLTAAEDGRQQTVMDLLPGVYRSCGCMPVGRLDKDTTGLLVLTTDGELAHRLIAPGRHVDKVYFVRVEGTLTAEDAAAFAAGMTLGDGLRCMPAGLERLPEPDTALVTLREGKYHQIKRMLACRGKPVRYLKRLSMGPLRLDEDLGPGEWRELTAGEIQALTSA